MPRLRMFALPLLLLAAIAPAALAAPAALPDRGPAPELTGIRGWLNTEPTSLHALRGKVVLVKFWTFACINCQRTQPATQGWYDRYHARGFEIISVHTPELDIERDPANVAAAVRKAHITYPVALDRDGATWDAYANHYWPAAYLIDKRGHIRLVHFGEGAYDTIDHAIATLLAEPVEPGPAR